MPASTLFLVFSIIETAHSCIPTRPSDPGILVASTRSPTNPEATTQPGTMTDAPVTQAPVTQAPVTEAPVTEAPVTEAPITEAPITEPPPPCKTCKAVDLVLDTSGTWYKPYSSVVESEIDGCTQLEVVCQVGDDYSCNESLGFYLLTENGYIPHGTSSARKASGLLICGAEGLWKANLFGNLDLIEKYYCYENACSNG